MSNRIHWGPDDLRRDVEGAAGRMTHRATRSVFGGISSCVGSIIISIVLGIVFLCGGIAVVVYVFQAASGNVGQVNPGGGSFGDTADDETVVWDGTTPFSCGGIDKSRIEGTTAKLDRGPAITVGGNCKLELVDVTIEAPDGLNVSGNGKVTMTNTTIKATGTAITASGNGKVNAGPQCSVDGKINTSANGKVTGVK